MLKETVMNKKIYSLMLTLLALAGLVSSCSDKEDITFDHERQQFETRADRILLEYIAPFGTTATEEVYIIGPFNGNSLTPNAEGKYETPVLDEAYKLMKAEKSNAKWGIYLDPAAFQNGKTLADGFRFYSVTQGNEAELGNDVVYAIHNDNPAVGSFTNVWGQRWESYYWGADGPTVDHDIYLRIFDGGYEVISKDYQGGGEGPTPDPEPTADKVIIAVKNSAGYADPHLYVWGDSEACGGWPGAAPVKVTDNGWCLFEVPAGGTYHPILNDNGSPQVDGPEVFTNGSMFFDVATEWVLSQNTVTIQNNAGYSDPRLYAWGSGEIYGGWRGIKPTSNDNGTLVFPLPNDGGEYNLILNGEGDGVQQDIATVIANKSYTFTAN